MKKIIRNYFLSDYFISICIIVIITNFISWFVINLNSQNDLDYKLILVLGFFIAFAYPLLVCLTKKNLIRCFEIRRTREWLEYQEENYKTNISYRKGKLYYKNQWLVEVAKQIFNTFLLNVSFDYLITFKIKESLKRRGYDYTLLIKLYNVANLFLSLTLTLTLILILMFLVDFLESEYVILVSYILIMLRVFSRGVEIMIAFLQDTIKSKTKNTELDSGERIKLAIISLVEITVLFTIVYLPFTEGAIGFETILNSFIFSLGISTLTDVNLTFEVVNNNLVSFTLAKSFIIGFQLIISLSLIVLSIAQYIGNVQSEK